MRELERRFDSGEMIPAIEFNNGALDIFADKVWPMVHREEVTRQLDMDGEVWYRRVHPIDIKTPEELHLCRPEPRPKNVLPFRKP